MDKFLKKPDKIDSRDNNQFEISEFDENIADPDSKTAEDSASMTSSMSTASTSSFISELGDRKRKKMSMVWDYFKKSRDKHFAKCRLCGKEYKTSGNTSNLSDHIKRFHADSIFNENTPDAPVLENLSKISNQRSVSPFFRKEQHYKIDSQRKKSLDRALIMMIACDYQPFSIVQDEGFKKFVYMLDPRYVLSSPDTLKNRLLKELYDEASTKLFEILQDISYVGITTDIWTSVSNQSYISVTCNFIDTEYDIKSATLSTKLLENHHTSENIANTLKDVFDTWGISDKISCIVTDNAANMLKACELLKKRNLPCFAHTLNLTVQDNLKIASVQNIFKRCKDIVKFFKSSPIATEKFNDEQKQLGKGTANELKGPYKLVQEVPTRWNSYFYMIQRILKTSDALNNVLLKLRNAPQPLNLDDIAILKDIEKALSIFEDATQKISGCKYVTVSLIIPITCGIYNYLSSLTLSTEIGREFCNGLIQSVQNRLFSYENRTVPRLSTILDARFKKEGFRSVENANQASAYLEQEIINALKTATNAPDANKHDKETNATRSVMFNFLEKKLKEKSRNYNADAIITKRQYLEKLNISTDMDPLLFWKVNETGLKPLHNLAKRYFCIPASSVESERSFSGAGLILTDRRSRLKSNYVDMLIFIKKNNWVFS